MADSPEPDAPHLAFESGGFRYELSHPLLEHPDYDPLWLAWCEPLAGEGPRRQVVLKWLELPPGREGRGRALEEVRLATHLRHPGITRVLGLAEHQETPYVAMEHIPGAFLATVIDAALLLEHKPSPALCAYVVAEVAEALDYAHRCEDDSGRPLRIIHRAVSPMSIRLGAKGRVKLCNFGAAWSELLGRLPTPPRILRGNLAYLAPELILCVSQEGKAGLSSQAVDGRADVFSLGLVLLELLTGRYPLDPPEAPPLQVTPRTARLVSGVRAERPAWASVETLAERLLGFGPEEVEHAAQGAPAPLKQVAHRALRQEPAERYPSAADLRDELRAYLHGLGRPFGAAEAEAELASLLEEASALDSPKAAPIEQGVLTPPRPTVPGRYLH